MEREPNLIISSALRHIVEEDIPFKADIYKLEGGDGWSLEVVTADGTSIVWDDLFKMIKPRLRKQSQPFEKKAP